MLLANVFRWFLLYLYCFCRPHHHHHHHQPRPFLTVRGYTSSSQLGKGGDVFFSPPPHWGRGVMSFSLPPLPFFFFKTLILSSFMTDWKLSKMHHSFFLFFFFFCSHRFPLPEKIPVLPISLSGQWNMYWLQTNMHWQQTRQAKLRKEEKTVAMFFVAKAQPQRWNSGYWSNCFVFLSVDSIPFNSSGRDVEYTFLFYFIDLLSICLCMNLSIHLK